MAESSKSEPAKSGSQVSSSTSEGRAAKPSPAKKPGSAKPAAEETSSSAKPAKKGSSVDAATVRSWLATAVWVLAVIAALVLAAAALAVSLDFNRDNPIVSFVIDTAKNLKVFDDFKKFKGGNREVKNILVNNGIYAILYLVVGKILDRVIRP